MASILDDLKTTWGKPNSLLPRLILVNAFVFIAVNIIGLFIPAEYYHLFIQNLAMPTSLIEGRGSDIFYTYPFIYKPWTFFTAFFTHQGFRHILFNMLALYWFGKLIRDFLGDRKLLSLYFLGGIAGSLSMLILFNIVPGFGGGNGIGYGASAAVFAVMVAAATKFPDYNFNLILIGPVKIKYIVLVFLFFSFTGLKGDNVGGEVAHLAGALIGFVYIRQLHNGTDLGKPILTAYDFLVNFFKPKPKIKVTHRSGSRRAAKKTTASGGKSSMKPSVDEPPQEEIDAILDKISQSGYDSLSKDEKQKLFNASNK